MTKSLEIATADNGFITTVYDGPHKTTWIHNDFPALKKYVNDQLRSFEPCEKMAGAALSTGTPDLR